MKLKCGQRVKGTGEPTNPILFDGLNADTILQIAMHTEGAAGPELVLALLVWMHKHGDACALHSNQPEPVYAPYSNHSNPSRGLECSGGLSPLSLSISA